MSGDGYQILGCLFARLSIPSNLWQTVSSVLRVLRISRFLSKLCVLLSGSCKLNLYLNVTAKYAKYAKRGNERRRLSNPGLSIRSAIYSVKLVADG
jgi:hypothetical protein